MLRIKILYYRLVVAWCTIKVKFWQTIIDLCEWVERQRTQTERSINMKAKLYINSEESTIKVEGSPSDVLHLLVCAIAQILKSYFPDSFEKQMGWVSGLLYNTIRELKEDDDED